MTNAMLINLVTVKRGPMTSHLPNAYARRNAQLIAYVKGRQK